MHSKWKLCAMSQWMRGAMSSNGRPKSKDHKADAPRPLFTEEFSKRINVDVGGVHEINHPENPVSSAASVHGVVPMAAPIAVPGIPAAAGVAAAPSVPAGATLPRGRRG